MIETPATPGPAAPAARPPEPAPRRTVIEPPAGWQLIDLGELWRFRELVFFLIWRDVKVRYKQAALGIAWAVLQPALLMAVFSVFLGQLGGLSGGETPYPLFVLAGLIAWTFFSAAVGQAGGSVIGSERLITKIYFPRLAVPFAAVGAAAFDFAISLGLLGVVMAAYGYPPSWQIVFAPLAFGVLLTAATGLGTLLAALTVTYRDFRFVTPFLIQVGMYATPTIYMMVPADPSDGLRLWLALNPLVAPIAAFRACVLGGPVPWGGLALSAGAAAALFVFGCLYFRKVEDEFADRI
ncbi:ABC transporter permease [Frigoriglobus tundricola]|uniref:Transport permease protein n=1 Tax=Frigoriglobus tundricola TaxID=2774151 RepID=A0A6M5YVU0_9BACT|nr:ABC transporter permease [Frigoriglobus tundricola]QJW98048.1 O-antigen export system, permease protein [Frigoriglobus tundricola]